MTVPAGVLHSGSSSAEIADFIVHIRPLDLMIFKGAEGVSRLIRTLEKYETTSGEISHVEVAITRDWCKNIGPIRASTNVKDTDSTLFSWGSTLSGRLNDGVLNAETGGVTFGVQIRVLEDLVREYLRKPGANVGVCRLLDNPTVPKLGESGPEYQARCTLLRGSISNAYKKYNGAGYNANVIALLGSLFPALRPIRSAGDRVLGSFTGANKWLFCSEWAATLYEEVGVITDATDGVIDGVMPNPQDIVPVDFLGYDKDANGIVKPICQMPPFWAKKLLQNGKKCNTTANTRPNLDLAIRQLSNH